jgi:hypothetical protein
MYAYGDMTWTGDELRLGRRTVAVVEPDHGRAAKVVAGASRSLVRECLKKYGNAGWRLIAANGVQE